MRALMKFATGLCSALALQAMSAPALAAACRVTDFTDKPLSALSEVQRLSFVTEMTQTEYDTIKAAKPGSPNHYDLIAQSETIRDARKRAHDTLYGLGIENIDGYREVWASDFLTDEQLRRFLDCNSSRQPGLDVAGRWERPGRFNMSFTHITPIGIEKITTKLIASHNIANVSELEKFLAELGPQDNYTARTIPLEIVDPKKRAVVVMRAGWESPKFLYIPVHPTPDYFARK